MAQKMESEQSYSDSSSSDESSSGSSEAEEDALEPVRILGHTIELPQDLCEDFAIFKEFFSMKTWDSLESEHKEHLMKFLPKFPNNQEEEQIKTVKMLFTHEPFHFTSPLSEFYNNLRQGNYRPDIAKMRKFLMRARAKQQRHKIKSYYAKLLPEILISRERLLAIAKDLPPCSMPHIPLLPPKSKTNFKPVYMRARQRYFEELVAIRSEVGGDDSDDENFPEGPPEQYTRKRKQHVGQNVDSNISGTLGGSDTSNPTSMECLKNVLAGHRARRQYRENHPELNTTGISLEDIKQRVALVNGTKKLMFGGQKADTPTQKLKRGPKKDSQKQSKADKCKKVKEDESVENKPLLPNIKIKCERDESDSESSSIVDPVASPLPSRKLSDSVEVKQEVVDLRYPNMGNLPYKDNKLENAIKQESPDLASLQNAGKMNQAVPIKLEDLDGIDMMALPVEIADDLGEVVALDSSIDKTEDNLDVDESLTETTHANFLSLVRALFPARAAHRASKQQLHARCSAVMSSPIAPLNTWYSLSDDWCSELDSALDFLAGERGPHPDDFVPYLQYMPETQMYQWIGAGRDCDAILGRLCERWLRAVTPPPTSEPPPPRYPTSHVIRTPTSAELADFRAQERRRFSSAAKPFTYTQYGYKAVVGPCARASLSLGGQAALLAPQRPRHANFIAIVRDAVARLPNGEGTRQHVAALVKMSQWVAPCSEQSLLSAVSSALDRLAAAKRDPLVKYDARTALWTSLHRNRTEEDWLRSAKGRKAAGISPTTDSSLSTSNTNIVDLDVGSMEEVIENASDSDVDVDDSGGLSSPPRLSSAQLLMQATLASKDKPKVKAKLIPTQKKPKQTPTKPIIQKQTTPKTTPAKSSVKVNAVQNKQTTPTSKPNAQKQVTPQVKQVNLIPQQKNLNLLPQKPQVKTNTPQPKQNAQTPVSSPKANSEKPNLQNVTQTIKGKQAQQVTPVPAKPVSQPVKPVTQAVKPVAPPTKPVVQPAKPVVQSPKPVVQPPKPVVQPPKPVVQPPKPVVQGAKLVPQSVKPVSTSKVPPPVSTPPHKSPLLKHKPLQKTEESPAPMQVLNVPPTPVSQMVSTPTVTPPAAAVIVSTTQAQKLAGGTRSLLLPPPAPAQSLTQTSTSSRRGVVRVLSPAMPAAGKSLISPRALLQQGAATKKRASLPSTTSVTTLAQSSSITAVVSSATTAVSTSLPARTVQLSGRTVQLPGGRTVQLAGQAVQLPGGQTVQLAGHTLQLSSILPTQSVRLPSGQTVQLASPQAVRVKTPTLSRAQSSPTLKQQVQIPVSTVQLAGQTVQIAGQTVQLAAPGVLAGHTVKLAGQSVQVAGQGVQLPTGQTMQLGNVQTVQLTNQVPGQSVQLAPQTVQIAGQTVQLGGQTLQLSTGQTLQLPSGQTLQLSGGQTLQLASGQTVQLNQQKLAAQVVRSQAPGDKTQPMVAKLLTNQPQMVSMDAARRGVRVVTPSARLSRPLLLTAAKPIHNIILQQQGEGNIRVTSSGVAPSSQTIVLSNLGAQAVTTSTASAPVLKLQQGVPTSTVATSSGVRSVLMEGQPLKLVGGRHVLARLLRPAHPPP